MVETWRTSWFKKARVSSICPAERDRPMLPVQIEARTLKKSSASSSEESN